MRGFTLNRSFRTAPAAAATPLALCASAAPAAQANVLSILPGACGNQTESQIFAPWGDTNQYTPVAGGSFESGTMPWMLARGAAVATGNESFNVGKATDSRSLSLPSGSQATSPAVCASIYHPTARFFARNSGSTSSRLRVEALYPGLLGGVQVAKLGDITATSKWAPSPVLRLGLTNLLATLSLDQTAIAYRFTPEDTTGKWSIDDVYLDPRCRYAIGTERLAAAGAWRPPRSFSAAPGTSGA